MCISQSSEFMSVHSWTLMCLFFCSTESILVSKMKIVLALTFCHISIRNMFLLLHVV